MWDFGGMEVASCVRRPKDDLACHVKLVTILHIIELATCKCFLCILVILVWILCHWKWWNVLLPESYWSCSQVENLQDCPMLSSWGWVQSPENLTVSQPKYCERWTSATFEDSSQALNGVHLKPLKLISNSTLPQWTQHEDLCNVLNLELSSIMPREGHVKQLLLCSPQNPR
jgi:hypothetical protein